MFIPFKSPYGDVVVSIFFILCFNSINGSDDFWGSSTTLPPHRGAARQMYGSGNLRQTGTKPIFATGQKHHGIRTTVSPNKKLPYSAQSYPVLPYFISVDEIERTLGRQPVLIRRGPDILIDTSLRSGFPTKQGGIYGGRPEYHDVRRNPGISRGIDLGFLEGRGFGKLPPDYDIAIRRRPQHRKKIAQSISNIKNPDDDVDEVGMTQQEIFEHRCGSACASEEFMCVNSCTCIKSAYRCDGDADCDTNEDELGCAEIELIRNRKCDESKNYIRCPRSGKCILKDWLCDGDDDCGDFSDETHCGFTPNCTVDQFECANGMCIPKNWVCDNDVDCKDFSDELNCTRVGCTKNQFECGDGSCISLGWKCDRQIDCLDESDENNCDIEPMYCGAEEFQCATQKCVKSEFKCDGDDDCGDWSDEENCDQIPGSCDHGEFKCNNGKCVPERYRCDKQQDCEDNEDEINCDYSVQKSCSPDEYACKSGACILKTWVCDGFDDCSHSEDELGCEIICDESKFPCTGPDPKDNTTHFCVNKKRVCDGQKDCPKGEDEIGCPKKRECEKGTNCTQLCIQTSDNKNACSCLLGYKLSKDEISCEDVNECLYATDPVCSQKCTNTVGSFKCGCMTGYILRPDLRSCKAVGASPTLLFANRKDIREVALSNSKYTAILKGLHNAIALDYHFKKKYIFWSDVTLDVIRRADINGTNRMDIIKTGLEAPGGVAIDWIHDLIFWTDSGTRRIEVSTLDGVNRAIIAANDVDKPRAIVVHPGEALVFWTDWGPNPKIESAEMDGQNRKSVITESVFWPNGLTLDYTSNRIYWADAKHNVIETSLLDGSDRKKVVNKGLPHPFAITIFEDAIYWTDWHTKSISTANKATGAGFRTIHSKLHFPMDIHSYHPQRQPSIYVNRCGNNNGGCAHMCLPNKISFTCVCRLGQQLGADTKSCVKPDKFLLFARKKDLRLKHLDHNAAHQHDMVIPVEGIKSAMALDWDSKTDSIFWTDLEKDTINRASWNGSNQEVIIGVNLVSPAGLAYDWITDKIYWTDAGTSKIEVAKINGESRTLLIWDNLDKPRDIIVDPTEGYMYWSDWGDKPKIEKAAMDGTMRSVLVEVNITSPNGLAIDHKTSKLYWTDGGLRTIECSNLDGSGRKIILEGSSIPHPFGLDVFDNNIYWTDWQSTNLEKATVSGLGRSIIETKIIGLMDVKVFHRERKIIQTGCDHNNGGCSHLCLLKPKGVTCACPTGITLGNDGKSCASGPKNFLLLAHRTNIRQISLDVPYTSDVVLPFHQLKMAVTVDVDRKSGEIFWADSTEDVIQKCTPDGKQCDIIIMHEILSPDGIAIDSTGRKIYWTDGDRNSIEVAELNGTNRKVLFSTDLDKPRAITLHYHHGLMFWSDWGTKPKIEVASMDGTNRTTLIRERLQWPNGLAIDRPAGRLYWNDAKLNKIESCNLNGKDRKVIIKDVRHPYGLVVVGNHMYWTDWQTQGLHRADKITGSDKKIIRGNLKGLMDVRAVQSDNIAENACGIHNGGCSHLCLRNPVSYSCACPTGLLMLPNSTTQCTTLPSDYLLISTRFAISRISLDTDELWDVTLPIHNINNVMDIDFHGSKNMIFYSDLESHAIKSINMLNYSDVRNVVYSNLSSPDGIAVDWIADNIYWTGKKIIEVSRLDGSHRKTIISKDIHDPRSIAVFPRRGYLYWTDCGDPRIEMSYLDGSSRKIIVSNHLTFPISLVVDYIDKRIYWVDAKRDNEIIETTNLHGRNRVTLSTVATSPYSLTQFGNHIYWTDWKQKTVFRADKTSGGDILIVRNNLDAALGITMVSERRQIGWNPCAINNGECQYLCFFLTKNYTCGCPDNVKTCNTEPKKLVINKCPKEKFKCDYETDDDEDETIYYPPAHNNIPGQPDEQHSNTIYIIILVPMIFIALISVGFISYIFFKKGKKTYLYATGRSFSNPNYYSSNNEANNANAAPGDKRQFIWKRLKYDKSQERVYEETVGTSSPEVASLIPTILTPCSSNCEAVTPELEHSPSATPLHHLDNIIHPVV